MDEDKKGDVQPTTSDSPQTVNTLTEPEPLKEQARSHQYCAVYGCDMMDENTSVAKPVENDPPNMEIVSFPVAAKVCETLENSSLQEFNPLNDSEPYLKIDMTN